MPKKLIIDGVRMGNLVIRVDTKHIVSRLATGVKNNCAREGAEWKTKQDVKELTRKCWTIKGETGPSPREKTR